MHGQRYEHARHLSTQLPAYQTDLFLSSSPQKLWPVIEHLTPNQLERHLAIVVTGQKSAVLHGPQSVVVWAP